MWVWFRCGVSALACFVLIGAVTIFGGLANHARGGWDPAHLAKESGYWGNHILGRFLMAFPSGLFTFLLLVGRSRLSLFRALIAGISVCLAFWVTLVIGWGTYMSIECQDGFKSRTGAWDWLLGRPDRTWSCNNPNRDWNELVWSRCWRRCFVGMSLRGLQWTVPGFFGLVLLGYDPCLLYLGAMMGTWYDVAHNYPKEGWDKNGLMGAEVTWGWFLWFSMTIFLCQRHVLFEPVWLWTFKSLRWVVFHLATACLCFLFFLSAGFYSRVHQGDMDNMHQTLFGCILAAIVTLVGQVSLWFVGRTVQKRGHDRHLQTPNTDVLDDDSLPLLNLSSVETPRATRVLLVAPPTWWEWINDRLSWLNPGVIVLAWLLRVIVIGTFAFVTVLTVVVTAENFGTPRICHDPECP